jgi:hypothetical protein
MTDVVLCVMGVGTLLGFCVFAVVVAIAGFRKFEREMRRHGEWK